MSAPQLRVLARTEEEMQALGAQLARTRPDPAQLTVLYLTGELGAGKTTLVRGFLHAAGIGASVRSPTFTLVELYALGDLTAVHVDLYRLRSADELDGLGLRDWARDGYLWLIEWPERAAGRLPPADLTLQLAVGPSAHTIKGYAGSPRGAGWLESLCRAMGIEKGGA